MVKIFGDEKSDLIRLLEIRHIIETSNLQVRSEIIQGVDKMHSEIKSIGKKLHEVKGHVDKIKASGKRF